MPSTINIIKWLGFRSRKMNETDSFMALILHWVYHTKGNNRPMIPNDYQSDHQHPPTRTCLGLLWTDICELQWRAPQKRLWCQRMRHLYTNGDQRTKLLLRSALAGATGRWTIPAGLKLAANHDIMIGSGCGRAYNMAQVCTSASQGNLSSTCWAAEKKDTSTHKGHGPLSVANFIWREVLKKAKSNKPTTLKKLLVLLTHSFSIYI